MDFVVTRYIDMKKIKKLLGKIAFKEKGRHFKHKNIEYFIEFIPPPLSVGEESVKEISEIKVKKYLLKILSPTDCVKDRLAAFYHWNDRQSLYQALMVCKEQKVNLNELKRWSKNEGMINKFFDFKKELIRYFVLTELPLPSSTITFLSLFKTAISPDMFFSIPVSILVT